MDAECSACGGKIWQASDGRWWHINAKGLPCRRWEVGCWTAQVSPRRPRPKLVLIQGGKDGH